MCFNTRPNGLVFKQLPRDLANVNACKNMCHSYSKVHQHLEFRSTDVKEGKTAPIKTKTAQQFRTAPLKYTKRLFFRWETHIVNLYPFKPN